MTETVPKREWEESREEYAARLRRICADINDNCDVEGLCRGLPKRIAKLAEKEGGRLKH